MEHAQRLADCTDGGERPCNDPTTPGIRPNKDVEGVTESAFSLDLERPMTRVMRERGWDAARAQTAVLEYRRFLIRCATNPGGNVPTEDADAIWHAHLLFTRQYHADCMRVAGYFIHHEPLTA
jgi:hypothetical protein